MNRSIYIGFSYPKEFKIGAKAIAWWTNSNYSHVYIRFESSNPRIPSTVYHAAHGMVHFREFSKFKQENNVIKEYQIPITDDQKIDILSHCMTLSGDSYGYSELPKIFISDVAYNSFNRVVEWENGKGYICSELVGKILADTLQIKFCRPQFLLKPNHIDHILGKSHYQFMLGEFNEFSG